MRRQTLFLAAGLLAACADAPTEPPAIAPAVEPSFVIVPTLSPGCSSLASGTWDGDYPGEGIIDYFAAGEVVSVTATNPVGGPTLFLLGEVISAQLLGAPFGETLTLTMPGFPVFHSVFWRVHEGDASASATFTVSCSPPANTAPVATDDAGSTDEDVPLNVAVLANDTDANGDPLTASLVAGPANGSATLNADGSFTYTPAADYNGPDSFTYKANDGLADSNVATVLITVRPVNDAPVAVDDAYETDEGVPLIIAARGVLTNDTDVDGDALIAAPHFLPANGNTFFSSNGSFTYTPKAGFYGSDFLTYRANDGNLLSNIATVTITVNRVIPVTIVISSDKKDAPNTINTKGNGLVSVAILGDPGEFALTEVDWTTLAFGPAGASAAHDLSNPATWAAHVVDVNGDGVPDLVTHYSQKATGLVAGDTQACLTGEIGGVAIEACGAVIVR